MSEFRVECYPMEVTSLSRPDPAWRFVDAAGHEHRWYTDGKPAESYRPDQAYSVPSTVRVEDPSYFDEDGEEIKQSHLECSQCGAVVYPGRMPDTERQYIAGYREYFIDDQPVDPDTFSREIEKARGSA